MSTCLSYIEVSKRDENLMDFHDLIQQAVHVVTKHAQARRYYHNRYKVAIVDEFQDTSRCVMRWSPAHARVFSPPPPQS